MPSTHRLRIVTYNTHKCRGLDGRVRPSRVLRVLKEIDADVIALQEVLSVPNGNRERDQARFLAEELNMNYCVGQTRLLKGGIYGNVTLTKLHITRVETYDLSVKWREQRGCVRTDLETGGGTLHVFNVHLGTSYFERRHQGRKLVDTKILHNDELTGARVVLGDFNEWTLGLTTRLLETHLQNAAPGNGSRRHNSYPVFLPVLALDHIYFDAALSLHNVEVHRTPAAMAASDHFPVIADFELHAPAVI